MPALLCGFQRLFSIPAYTDLCLCQCMLPNRGVGMSLMVAGDIYQKPDRSVNHRCDWQRTKTKTGKYMVRLCLSLHLFCPVVDFS